MIKAGEVVTLSDKIIRTFPLKIDLIVKWEKTFQETSQNSNKVGNR